MVAIAALIFSALSASVIASPTGASIHPRQDLPDWASTIPIGCQSACSGYAKWADVCATDITACAKNICSSAYVSDVKSCIQCVAPTIGQTKASKAISDLEAVCSSMASGLDLASMTLDDTGSDSLGSATSSGSLGTSTSGAAGAPTTSAATGPKTSGISAASTAPTATKASGAGTITATWSFAGIAVVAALLV